MEVEETMEEEMMDDVIEEDTDSLVDDDEITPEEEGFLKGYDEAEGSFDEKSEE